MIIVLTLWPGRELKSHLNQSGNCRQVFEIVICHFQDNNYFNQDFSGSEMICDMFWGIVLQLTRNPTVNKEAHNFGLEIKKLRFTAKVQ